MKLEYRVMEPIREPSLWWTRMNMKVYVASNDDGERESAPTNRSGFEQRCASVKYRGK